MQMHMSLELLERDSRIQKRKIKDLNTFPEQSAFKGVKKSSHLIKLSRSCSWNHQFYDSEI